MILTLTDQDEADLRAATPPTFSNVIDRLRHLVAAELERKAARKREEEREMSHGPDYVFQDGEGKIVDRPTPTT